MSLAHEKYLELQRLRNAAPIALDPHRTALMIIDMQEYFLHPDSPLSRACDAQVPSVSKRHRPCKDAHSKGSMYGVGRIRVQEEQAYGPA